MFSSSILGRVALAAAVLLVLPGPATTGTHAARDVDGTPSIERIEAGNLQVGVVGQLLPWPVAVRTAPGRVVTFRSPDLGRFEESGRTLATVRADARGLARAHVRLGQNPGQYTVLVRVGDEAGPEVVYRLRALTAEQMATRAGRFGLAPDGLAASREGAVR